MDNSLILKNLIRSYNKENVSVADLINDAREHLKWSRKRTLATLRRINDNRITVWKYTHNADMWSIRVDATPMSYAPAPAPVAPAPAPAKSKGKCNIAKIKSGDKLSRVSYMTVVAVNAAQQYLTVKNTQGFEWDIGFDIVAEECYAATQFHETKKVTRTELADVLESAGDTAFTVVFRKQVTQKQLQDYLSGLQTLPKTPQDRRAVAKDILAAGSLRTLTGYLVNSEPKMGRSVVVDMNITSGHPLRQVDHRTLQSLILRNVRYEVKS